MRRYDDRFYTMFVFVVFVVVIVTNIIQAFYITNAYEAQVLENYYEYAEKSLEQFRNSVDSEIGAVMSLVSVIAADEEINRAVRDGTIIGSPELADTKKYMLIMSDVLDISFFNPDMDEIFSIKNNRYMPYNDYWEGMNEQTVEELEKQRVVKRKIYVEENSVEVITICLLSDWLYDSYIIVDISFDGMLRDFKRYARQNKCELAVLAKTGSLFRTSEELFKEKYSNNSLIEAEGKKYGATLVKSNSFDMEYVVLKEYESIRKIYIIKRQISFILVYFLIFGAGIIILYFSMKHSYKPIGEIVRKYEKLKERGKKETEKDYFREFITSPVMSENRTDKVYKFAAGYLDITEMINLITVMIDDYTQFREIYTPAEQSAYKYAIENVFMEIISEHYKCFALENDSNSEFFLISGVSDDKHLKELIVLSTEQIKEHLGISLSGVIAESCRFDELNEAYNETRSLENYRIVFPKGSLIKSEGNDCDYDARYEDAIRSSTEEGDFGKMSELLDDFTQHLRTVDPETISIRIINLLSVLYGIITKKWNITEISMQEIMRAVLEAENIEDVKKVFLQLFEKAEKMQTEISENKHHAVVERVYKEIDANWADPYFCVETISNKMKYSGIHLSRIFKYATGKSIPNLIMEKRLEESEKVLVESDIPIKEIFEKCGFASNSYFCTMFKKRYGASPSEYRRNILEKKN